MKYILVVLIAVVIASAGVIHPLSAEKIATNDNELLQEDWHSHDCGSVKLSVTRWGSIGYMNSNQSSGEGFQYPIDGLTHLFFGGFATGTDSNYCVDRYMGLNRQDDRDWETTSDPDGRVYWFEPGGNNMDEYSRAIYDDSGHPSAQGLLCWQNSWAWDDTDADAFVIMKFSLINEGSNTITDLYNAVFMDWDIIASDQNEGDSDTTRNLTYMWFGAIYCGVAILDPPRTTLPANLALIDHELYVYPDTGMRNSTKIKFMDGTIQNPASNRVYDWSTCNSSGPITLGPGESVIAAFAIIGGDNVNDIQVKADTAYNRYWNWPGVEERPSESITTDISLYPLISSGKRHTLSYSFAKETALNVTVYDAIGRVVVNRDYGMLNGSGKVRLDLNSLAQGIYFAEIDAGEYTKTEKIVRLK